jgi:hypothetical protein
MIAEEDRKRKMQQEMEKQYYRENVRKTMFKLEERRKKSIVDKRN